MRGKAESNIRLEISKSPNPGIHTPSMASLKTAKVPSPSRVLAGQVDKLSPPPRLYNADMARGRKNTKSKKKMSRATDASPSFEVQQTPDDESRTMNEQGKYDEEHSGQEVHKKKKNITSKLESLPL